MSFGMIIRAIVAPFFKILHPMKIEGLENYAMDKPFVLCANHQSNLDVFSLYIASPRQLHFMAKEELFRFKPLGWLLKKMGAFPVRRNQTDITAIKNALKVLKDGNILGIFPQGSRMESIEADDAKAGAVLIAGKARVPILPAVIITNYKLFHPVKVKFGKMMEIAPNGERLSNDEIKEKAVSVMEQIRVMWEEG